WSIPTRCRSYCAAHNRWVQNSSLPPFQPERQGDLEIARGRYSCEVFHLAHGYRPTGMVAVEARLVQQIPIQFLSATWRPPTAHTPGHRVGTHALPGDPDDHAPRCRRRRDTTR